MNTTDNTLKPFCMMILNVISAVILSLTARHGYILWITTTIITKFGVSKGKICWERDDYYGGSFINTFHVHEQIWVQMLLFKINKADLIALFLHEYYKEILFVYNRLIRID